MKLFNFKSRKQKKGELEGNLEGKKTIQDYLREKDSGKAAVYVPQKAFQARSEEEVIQFLEIEVSQMKDARKAIEDAKEEYESITNSLMDVQIITDMPEDDKIALREAADKIKTLTQERESFQKEVSKITEAQYSKMDSYGDEIRNIMKKMDDDEKYSQLIQKDMQTLEGEKGTLRYDVDDYRDKLEVLQKLASGILFLLSACFVFFFVSVFALEKDYRSIIYIALAVIAIALTIVFIKNQDYTGQMKAAERKLNRVISLLNRSKVRYVNVQNSLDFQYEKYGVNSAYELNHIWGLYLEAKRERELYRHNSQELHEAQTELLGILSEYGLNDAHIWIYRADALLDNREMVEVRHELNVRRQKIRENMEYNKEVVEKTNVEIKEFTKLNKGYGDQIMAVVKAGLKV